MQTGDDAGVGVVPQYSLSLGLGREIGMLRLPTQHVDPVPNCLEAIHRRRDFGRRDALTVIDHGRELVLVALVDAVRRAQVSACTERGVALALAFVRAPVELTLVTDWAVVRGSEARTTEVVVDLVGLSVELATGLTRDS